jgi:hypothetical protein
MPNLVCEGVMRDSVMCWRALAAIVVMGKNSAVLKHSRLQGGGGHFPSSDCHRVSFGDVRVCLGFGVRSGMEWEVEAV